MFKTNGGGRKGNAGMPLLAALTSGDDGIPLAGGNYPYLPSKVSEPFGAPLTRRQTKDRCGFPNFLGMSGGAGAGDYNLMTEGGYLVP